MLKQVKNAYFSIWCARKKILLFPLPIEIRLRLAKQFGRRRLWKMIDRQWTDNDVQQWCRKGMHSPDNSGASNLPEINTSMDVWAKVREIWLAKVVMSVTFILLSRFISKWLFWDVGCIAVNYFVRYLDGILLNFRSNVSTCHQSLDTRFSFSWDNHLSLLFMFPCWKWYLNSVVLRTCRENCWKKLFDTSNR